MITREDMKDFSMIGLAVDGAFSLTLTYVLTTCLDVRRLAIEFNRHCHVGDLTVSMSEISAALDLPNTKLVRRLMTSLSWHKDRLNFKEFVFNMWSFLAMTTDMLMGAAFEFFVSRIGREYLSMMEVRNLLREIQGGIFALDSSTLAVLDSMQMSVNNRISKDEFVYTIRKHPRLGSPIFLVQVCFADCLKCVL